MASAAVSIPQVPKHQSNKSAPASSARSSSQRISHDQLNKLDPIFKAAFAVIPNEPYIVSGASDRPYAVPEDQRDNWRIRGFFDRSEQRLQYQTFKWQDMSDTVLQLSAMHEVKDNRSAASAVKPSPAIVRTATPVGSAGPKKKMTLGDYKNRTKGDAGDGTKAAAVGKSDAPAQPRNDERKMAGLAQQNAEAARASCNMMVEEALKRSDLLTVANTATPSALHERQARNESATKLDNASGLGRSTAHQEGSPGKRKRGDSAASRQRPSSPKRQRVDAQDHKDAQTKTQSALARKAQSSTKDNHQRTHDSATATPPSTTTRAPWPTPRPSESARTSSQPAPAWFGEEVKTESSLPTPPQHEDKPPPEPRDVPTWLSKSSWDDRITPPRLPENFRLIDCHPREDTRARQRMVRAGHALSPPPSASSPDTVRMSLTYSSNSSTGGDRVDEHTQDMVLDDKIEEESRPAAVTTAAATSEGKSRGASSDERASDGKTKKQEQRNVEEDSAEVEEERLVARLKIPKGLRADVQRLLKLKPTPRPSPRPTPAAHGPPDDIPTEKRAHDKQLTVPALKRHKSGSSDAALGPSTPKLQTLTSSPQARSTPSSAARPPASASKLIQDRTNATKTFSTQSGTDTKRPETPARPIPAKSTSTPGSSTNPPQSTNRPAPPDAAKWRSEYSRLQDLGRTLRNKMRENAIPHAGLPPTPSSTSTISTLPFPNATGFATNRAHHLAAIHGIESLLAFMLSLLAHDRSLPQVYRNGSNAFSTWASIPPYARDVVNVCAPWPHLAGLAQLLRAACEGVIVTAGAKGEIGLRASKDGPADHTATEQEQLAKKNMADMTILLAAIKGLQSHAAEAARLLPLEVLRREYAAASRYIEGGSVVGGVGLEPKAAVRAGMAFLREWTLRGRGRDVGWVRAVDVDGLLSEL